MASKEGKSVLPMKLGGGPHGLGKYYKKNTLI